MQIINQYVLATHAGPYEKWPARTALFKDGVATGTAVRGYQLLAQYRSAGGDILICDYDCPFEEAITCQLLNDRAEVCAQQTLGAPYDSFNLHRSWIENDSIVLHLFGHEFYRLRIGPARWYKPLGLSLKSILPWQLSATMRAARAELEQQLADIKRNLHG